MNTKWIVFKFLFKTTIFYLKKIEGYYFVTNFQLRILVHDHGLWSKDVLWFVISSNEEIESFINKYLTIDQTIFKSEIHKQKYINTNKHVAKKCQLICKFQYPNPLMKIQK